MGKIVNPVSFSSYYNIQSGLIEQCGAYNPTLNVDSPLFIDPLLLNYSANKKFRARAVGEFEQHFSQVLKLFSLAQSDYQVAEKAAKRLLEFPEVRYTCLGFSGSSIHGGGIGVYNKSNVISTIKEIISLGVDDPDLFVALAAFEDGIGPDRISDMTTNVILGALVEFSEYVSKTIAVPTDLFEIDLKNGKSFSARLPLNPFEPTRSPVVFVPADVLRELPIVKEWSDVANAASKNRIQRDKLNKHIGEIWKASFKKNKDQIRGAVLQSKESFDTFLEMLRGASAKPYDLVGDKLGEIVWRRISEEIASREPKTINAVGGNSEEKLNSVVDQINEQFQFLIEERRLSEELYHEGKPRVEKAAQRLYFAVALAYCKANNLDITPEADTGNGPVDFKISKGYSKKVVVEIKLSKNSKLVDGYRKQITTYQRAEEAGRAIYVVINVGGMGGKEKLLILEKNLAAKKGVKAPEIVFIDGARRKSASKLA